MPDPPAFSVPLSWQGRHLLLALEDGDWLLDTGAPTTFGLGPLRLPSEAPHPCPGHYLGLQPARLSGYVDHPVRGLVGSDVLSGFDLLLEPAVGRAWFSRDFLDFPRTPLAASEFMGVPLVDAELGGHSRRFYVDTGAQLSYLQDDLLDCGDPEGCVEDFHPGVGRFFTDSYRVGLDLAGARIALRFGRLPGLLNALLVMASAQGILGSEVLRHHALRWSPRRGLLAFE